jgi:hypothetical protein
MIEGFVFNNNKTIEGYSFIPNTVPGTLDFSNNLNTIKQQISQLSLDNQYLKNNYNFINTNPEYNIINYQDKMDMKKTTNDVRNEDVNSFVLEQNYLYIVGSVTCATLLIATIVISRK